MNETRDQLRAKLATARKLQAQARSIRDMLKASKEVNRIVKALGWSE